MAKSGSWNVLAKGNCWTVTDCKQWQLRGSVGGSNIQADVAVLLNISVFPLSSISRVGPIAGARPGNEPDAKE